MSNRNMGTRPPDSLVAQSVKNPPAMQETLVQSLGQEDQETLVQSLGQEDLLEKGQATHSSILELPFWLSW